MKEEKIISLARKLKALAEKGVQGEKENAIKKLEAFMLKHNLTEADINGEELKCFDVHFHKDIEFMFIAQVLASVIGQVKTSQIWQYNRVQKRNHITFEICDITAENFAEFVIKVEHYWNDYQEQMKVFYEAYIQTNKLYRKQSEDDVNQERQLTEEDYQRLQKIRAMQLGINRTNHNKRIES